MLGAVVPELLNVRSMPMAGASVLGQVTADKVIRGEANIHNWWQIRYHNSIGFVHSAYLKPVNDLSRLTGTVNTARLNVRAAPSAAAEYLATLYQGASVKTLAFLDDWLEIEFNHQTAYVAAPYVDLAYVSGGYSAVVTASLLNVRATPSATALLFGQLAQHSKIWVEGSIEGWSQIRFNGNRAYVASDFIERIAIQNEEQNAPIALVDHEADSVEPIPNSNNEDSLKRLTPTIILPVNGSNEKRNVAATWNRFGGLLQQLCDEKELEVGAALAVLCVESSGKGFEQNNGDRMIIRFENHKFWRYWGKHNPDQFRQHFRYRSDKVWLGHEWRKTPDGDWRTFHGRQSAEWEVLDFARQLDEKAALLSISMGAPQIMGFHYQRIGFQSVVEMFDAFSSHIQGQVRGLFDFFSPKMLRYLREHEFIHFAGMYNGSGQKVIYGEKIKKHYEAFKRIMPNQPT